MVHVLHCTVHVQVSGEEIHVHTCTGHEHEPSYSCAVGLQVIHMAGSFAWLQ